MERRLHLASQLELRSEPTIVHFRKFSSVESNITSDEEIIILMYKELEFQSVVAIKIAHKVIKNQFVC